MRFDIFTLFPEVFGPYLETSILQRAIQRGLVEVGALLHQDHKGRSLNRNRPLSWVGDTGIEPVTSSV